MGGVQFGLVLSRFGAAAVVMMVVQFVHGQRRHGLHRRRGHLRRGGHHQVRRGRGVVRIGTAGAPAMMLVGMLLLQVVVVVVGVMMVRSVRQSRHRGGV